MCLPRNHLNLNIQQISKALSAVATFPFMSLFITSQSQGFYLIYQVSRKAADIVKRTICSAHAHTPPKLDTTLNLATAVGYLPNIALCALRPSRTCLFLFSYLSCLCYCLFWTIWPSVSLHYVPK